MEGNPTLTISGGLSFMVVRSSVSFTEVLQNKEQKAQGIKLFPPNRIVFWKHIELTWWPGKSTGLKTNRKCLSAHVLLGLFALRTKVNCPYSLCLGQYLDQQHHN